MKWRTVDYIRIFFLVFVLCSCHLVTSFGHSLKDAGYPWVCVLVFGYFMLSLFLSCNYYLLRRVLLYDEVFMRCRGREQLELIGILRLIFSVDEGNASSNFCYALNEQWMMNDWAIGRQLSPSTRTILTCILNESSSKLCLISIRPWKYTGLSIENGPNALWLDMRISHEKKALVIVTLWIIAI